MNTVDLPPADDLDAGERYEIIDGVRVKTPPMSANSTALAFRLARLLGNHGIDQGVGEAYHEMLFKLPLPVDRNRRPDVAFVPYSRWPRVAEAPGGERLANVAGPVRRDRQPD